MAFKLYKKSDQVLRFLTSVDDAVDVSTPEKKEIYLEYLKNHDEGSLALVPGKKPVIFLLRPLTFQVFELATRDARGFIVPGKYCDMPTARLLLQYSFQGIENIPKDWGLKEEDMIGWLWSQRVLNKDVADALPSGLVLEAAEFLLTTLPLDDEPKKGGDDDAEPPLLAKPDNAVKKRSTT